MLFKKLIFFVFVNTCFLHSVHAQYFNYQTSFKINSNPIYSNGKPQVFYFSSTNVLSFEIKPNQSEFKFVEIGLYDQNKKLLDITLGEKNEDKTFELSYRVPEKINKIDFISVRFYFKSDGLANWEQNTVYKYNNFKDGFDSKRDEYLTKNMGDDLKQMYVYSVSKHSVKIQRLNIRQSTRQKITPDTAGEI